MITYLGIDEGVNGVIYSKVQPIVPVSVRKHKMITLIFMIHLEIRSCPETNLL